MIERLALLLNRMAGGASGAQGYGRAVRGENTEEGRDYTERRRGLRSRRKAGAGDVTQITVPRRSALQLSNQRNLSPECGNRLQLDVLSK